VGAAGAAAKVAASLGVRCTDPVILADGTNVIVYLSPAPVVANVAASTLAVRPEPGTWLQRELDVTRFLAGRGAPVVAPSPEVPATVYHADGQVMSFWRYVDPQARPGYHPGRAGGLWLWRILVLPGFQAVVVPSGFRTRVQPHRWITTWWWNQHSRTQSRTLVLPPLALCLT
jgi:hypothetical protein